MRKCEECEYYRKQEYAINPTCHLNPPFVLKDKHGHFPTISKNDFCSKWEPKWDDNPVITEAWELFQMTLKLTK